MNNVTSPYLHFDRNAWQKLRQDMPMPLTEEDLSALHGQIETVSLREIQEIYLPLSRLLSLYVTARQKLHSVSGDFLSTNEPKVPYIIGVAGSVGVGKSTTSRVLQALLSHWPDHPNVALVPTDGFIFPNETLEARGLMHRKGFPESYDTQALLDFLMALKSGATCAKAPVYSHHHYDIIPDAYIHVNAADIVIVEGLSILQTGSGLIGDSQPLFVSDFLDDSIYVDADTDVIESWYVERFQSFQKAAFQDENAYFYRFAHLNHEETVKTALRYWHEINLVNLEENILPYRNRARLILHKAADHSIDTVHLRKL
jgi:type I pantothenate kinase